MHRILTLLSGLLCSLALVAQYQLPNPGFEDWSGPTFDGKPQPTYWLYSNVKQFGLKFNFAERETGRDGSGYCMKVQCRDMKVMGINGGTSPGYVALGQPWAYVPSLSQIKGATAGCSGGIEFVHRPDSVVMWIKRTGPHCADENYNIVFYAWKGTAKGTGYLNKGGGTTPYEQLDEESDIRQLMDGNVCQTVETGTQVCEAYRFEKRTYNQWTRISIPVYYMNDQVPEKCNLILSAGHYPAGRANTGIYHGDALYVDDISLVYTAQVQKLMVGGREWQAFDPDNHEIQTCTLPKGSRTIPTLYCMRGAGTLINYAGKSASVPGRRLSDRECVIDRTGAAVNGAPVVISISSEDGRKTAIYRIRFVAQ